jgi:hypothetical protein
MGGHVQSLLVPTEFYLFWTRHWEDPANSADERSTRHPKRDNDTKLKSNLCVTILVLIIYLIFFRNIIYFIMIYFITNSNIIYKVNDNNNLNAEGIHFKMR